MKSLLIVVVTLFVVLTRVGNCAVEHLPFKFPHTEIVIKVQDSKRTIDVAKNTCIQPSGELKYQSGFEKIENKTSQGEVDYKYNKTTEEGDLYTFTITRPGTKTETINYTYTGLGSQLYSQDGITIIIQEKAG